MCDENEEHVVAVQNFHTLIREMGKNEYEVVR